MTKEEILEIISSLKVAYKRAAENGGVTRYSINSGQGSTSVQQASLAELSAEIKKYEQMYQELDDAESGACFGIVRGLDNGY